VGGHADNGYRASQFWHLARVEEFLALLKQAIRDQF
jgi:hypothetical protein